MPVTEHGGPYVDGPHVDGPQAYGPPAYDPPVYDTERPQPLDPVARVDLQRAQQARYGVEAHPDAALLASRLAHTIADSPAASHLAGPAVPHGAGPGATVD